MAIHLKINQVMRLVSGVEKTRHNKHGNFHYAGHEDVNERLRGHFAELGIVREARMLDCKVLDGGTILAQCEVSYVDAEEPSSVIRIPMWAVQPSQTSGKTVTAQQIGQALSYATKNVEFKLFALTGDGEADSDSSEAYNPREEPAPQQASQGVKDRAGELLTMFTRAASLDEVKEINAMCKAEWAELQAVKGFAERVVEVRTAAQKRLSAS